MAAALVPRLLVIFMLRAGRPPETFEFEAIVQNLLAGKGYVYHHHGTDYASFHSAYPYVFLSAVVYLVSHSSHTAMLLAQSLTSTILALVINALGRRVAGDRVGWLGGALVALHPGLLYYDTHKLHPLSLDALSIAAATLALYRLFTAPSMRRCAIAGLLSGFALLERGTFLSVILLCVGALWWTARGTTIAWRGPILFLLCANLLVGPWLIRNFRHHGVPVFVTTVGEYLWRGHNPNATGSSLARDKVPMILTAGPAFRSALLTRDELGQMRMFRDRAVRYIAEHPLRCVGNVAKRCFYFAWRSPTTGLLYPAVYAGLYQAYYTVMGVLAGLGFFHLIRRGRAGERDVRVALSLLLGVWMAVGLTQSLFYVELRHRWGVEGLMLVVSAIGILAVLSPRPAPCGVADGAKGTGELRGRVRDGSVGRPGGTP